MSELLYNETLFIIEMFIKNCFREFKNISVFSLNAVAGLVLV